LIYALGAFDGFHRGHLKLFEAAKKLAQLQNTDWGVATFDANPRLLLGDGDFKTLFNGEERDFFANCLAVPKLLKIAFTKELASLTPSDFMKYMTETFNLTGIVVGENCRFGKDRAGDTDFIENYCAENGLDAKVVPSVKFNGEILSSTLIRSFISEGNVSKALAALDFPYFITQKIIHGEGRGHTLGFPTANLCCEEYKLYPATGSYVTLTLLDGKIYPSVTNIGFNPTFGGKLQSCETHIIDFCADIYGKVLTVFFIAQNRPETKFETKEQLIKQLSLDVKTAKSIAGSYITANAEFINQLSSFDIQA